MHAWFATRSETLIRGAKTKMQRKAVRTAGLRYPQTTIDQFSSSSSQAHHIAVCAEIEGFRSQASEQKREPPAGPGSTAIDDTRDGAWGGLAKQGSTQPGLIGAPHDPAKSGSAGNCAM